MLESERVKVLIVGDSGVGKTALVHLICTRTPLLNPSFTVGCSLEVKIHLFRPDHGLERPFFVELWDIGGSNAHANTRAIFYQNLHGLILVYDCTNSKSQLHLKNWLHEVIQSAPNNNFETVNNGASSSGLSKVGHLFSYFASQDDLLSGVRLRSPDYNENDANSLRSTDTPALRFPVLIVGTKLDLLNKLARRRLLRRQDDSVVARWSGQTKWTHQRSWSSSIGDPAAQSISHSRDDSSCNNPDDLAPNSSNAVVLDKFFNDVILKKLGGTTANSHSPDALLTRRTLPTSTTEPSLRIGSLMPTDSVHTTRSNWFSWYVHTEMP
ncbi:Rab protein 3 [Fasciola hepatica]|uniref:Rab protein 3 n=1 Tax=Fasciola hepatica TaxID=6192 RepID=A0A4E0RAV2_FASHE|nr:Rab protein 3 [Fasciola hepatica]